MNETKRTLRERKFIDAYIKNNGNSTEAYLAVNPEVKRKNASVYGIRMLEKVGIEVNELLDKLELTNICLGKKLKEGLEAIKKVAGVDVPDHNIRVRYLDMAFKLKNAYPAEKGKPEGLPEDITIKVTIPDEGGAKEKIIKKLDELAEKKKAQKLADRLIADRKGN
ncbi:hypothetical protein ES703_125296 [subsurface metagenome]